MADAGTGRPAPLFGISFAPSAAPRDIQQAFELASIADDAGLDFVTIQDHPYNPSFLDTWTLLAAIGVRTSRIRLLGNVHNLPLRPPAMLAKAAASLDLITGGRVEMGLGAGAFWDGIAAYGGPRRTPGEALAALEEAIAVMRELWQPAAAHLAVSFEGRFYRLDGAQPGPAPAHPIGIWLGVYGPRALALTGRLADGWIVTANYTPPDEVPAKQDAIDAAARAAGREPTAIRRAYNVAGFIRAAGDPVITPRRQGLIVGEAAQWADELGRYGRDLRFDTFIFWPAGRDDARQIERFAADVVPAVRRALSV
jgi:alkanesulfonate monooxygenase SsuD/methylene tetrahydromethanopterin reductase-like flavin-dependent oxidoreductase (luciferase family)